MADPETGEHSDSRLVRRFAEAFLLRLSNGAYEEAYGMFSADMLNRINFVEMIDDHYFLEERYGPEMELILVEETEQDGGRKFRYLSRRQRDVALTIHVVSAKDGLRIQHYAIDIPSDNNRAEYAP